MLAERGGAVGSAERAESFGGCDEARWGITFVRVNEHGIIKERTFLSNLRESVLEGTHHNNRLFVKSRDRDPSRLAPSRARSKKLTSL